ncbi:MAG: grasp-with-spasm system ATP-grasp peptide maturase [Cytophagaceae bacterium]|jgi:ATP-GRASP peptide maturase of grasp-with-spasm system|nr:grasp-with-spasm system ATP-grasp peptide maturase [Cytophagaceae bacterium]
MIVIFTVESDTTTHEVMDWLDYYSQPFNVITPQNIHNKICLLINFIHSGHNAAFWFRKWSDENNSTAFKEATASESFKLISYIYLLTKQSCNWLNNPYDYNTNNKLLQEHFARLSGLKTPKSWVVNTRQEVEKLLTKDGLQFITKSFGSQIFQKTNGIHYFSYTTCINREETKTYPEYFFPSLIQEYIEKEYEIRTFYLDGCFYSMAIFSQLNNRTKVDFRHYDTKNPNRYESIKIPETIEDGLKRFLDIIGTNCGSFDLIQSPEGEIYFLEFNPLGQFGMVSKPCNYKLEQKVALLLTGWAAKNANSQKQFMQCELLKTNMEGAHTACSDALCMLNMQPVELAGASAVYYSGFYESDFASVQNLQKPIDSLC